MKLYFWKLTYLEKEWEDPIEGVLDQCTDIFLEEIIPGHVSSIDRAIWEIQDWIDVYCDEAFEFEYVEVEMSYEDAEALWIKQCEDAEALKKGK